MSHMVSGQPPRWISSRQGGAILKIGAPTRCVAPRIPPATLPETPRLRRTFAAASVVQSRERKVHETSFPLALGATRRGKLLSDFPESRDSAYTDVQSLK